MDAIRRYLSDYYYVYNAGEIDLDYMDNQYIDYCQQMDITVDMGLFQQALDDLGCTLTRRPQIILCGLIERKNLPLLHFVKKQRWSVPIGKFHYHYSQYNSHQVAISRDVLIANLKQLSVRVVQDGHVQRVEIAGG